MLVLKTHLTDLKSSSTFLVPHPAGLLKYLALYLLCRQKRPSQYLGRSERSFCTIELANFWWQEESTKTIPKYVWTNFSNRAWPPRRTRRFSSSFADANCCNALSIQEHCLYSLVMSVSAAEPLIFQKPSAVVGQGPWYSATAGEAPDVPWCLSPLAL